MATVGSLTGVVTAGFIGGTVTITYSIGSGCASTYTLFIIPEGISNLNAPHAIVVYPNPATNELTIQATPMAYSAYSITNETGVQITIGNITNAQTIVNVATLPPGLYFISLTGTAGRTVQRFLKE